MAMTTKEFPEELLNETIGAMFISAIIGAILQGITSCQTILYYVGNKSDPVVLKSLMFFVWTMDLIHTFFVTETVYIYTVNRRGDPTALSKLTWSAMAIILGNVIGDFGVKGIFSYRVWKISGHWYLGAIIMFTTLVTFALGVFTFVKMIVSPSSPPYAASTYGTLIALAVSDIFMSVILGAVIYHHRSAFPSINRILRRFVLYSAETSVITSVGAMIGLIIYAAFPNKPLFMAVLWILPYLISSSLLVALNAKQDLRPRSTINPHPSGHFDTSYGAALSSVVMMDIPSSSVSDTL